MLLLHMQWATLAAALFVTACAASMSPAIVQTPPQQRRAAELRSEIDRTGSLRVIVTLQIDGQEPASAEAIRATKERLLAALQGRQYKVLYLYPSQPLLALVVWSDALDVLLSSPLVRSITPDAKRHITDPTR